MEKFKLKNIDCANCAAKLETTLGKLKDVRYVSISFADSTMFIDTDNIKKVKEVIKQTEPDVEIILSQENRPDKPLIKADKNFAYKKELALITVVISLYIFGLVFREELHDTPFALGEYLIFLTAYLTAGWNVLFGAVRKILKGKLFDEHFLMSVATLGAIAINQIPEAVAVMIFYQIGEFMQQYSVRRSRNSIKALLEIKPNYANFKTKNGLTKVDPVNVNIDDIIIIKPGEKIPLDGDVLEGTSMLDTSPLTGESIPKTVSPGSKVLAGMININGLITVKVTKLFVDSSISKILTLVENASAKKAETEKFITKFSGYYTPVVVFGALLVALLPPLLFSSYSFSDWIYRALVILVISCPCALVISIPLGYFGGIGGASRRGILVKGSNFLDALTQVKTVVFDKTGTLTQGTFKVTEIITHNGYSKNDILKFAAQAESHSNHPISVCIRSEYGQNINSSSVKDYQEIAGQGVKAIVEGKLIIAGNDYLMHRENIDHPVCNLNKTVIHIAIDWKYAGYIIISDELKEDSKHAVKYLRSNGVQKIFMFTGDNNEAARIIANELDIDGYKADLLPEDKVYALEEVMKESGKRSKTAFIGDGINDAPVIARADVGIAMGALGSDAAIETADIVIMTDKPSKVGTAIEIAKKTRRIVWQNIIFALTVKAFFIVLGSFGVATMWEAVFGDMGVAIIAILNSTRVLK